MQMIKHILLDHNLIIENVADVHFNVIAAFKEHNFLPIWQIAEL